MRTVWIAAMVLVGVVVATDARGDTVYLRDGRSFWGTETLEDGDSVVVVRPGGDLRFPKAQVTRIERLRSTLPPFYTPPGAATPEGGPTGAPTAAAAPAGGPSVVPAPSGVSALPPPQATPLPAPTALPPPPSPPPYTPSR